MNAVEERLKAQNDFKYWQKKMEDEKKLIEDMSDRRYQNIMVVGVDPVGTIFSEVLQEQKESYV